jgi:hypothetical protein
VGLLAASFGFAESADEIMVKVAASQERGQIERMRYVYRESLHVKLIETGGRLAREEKREYTVTPTSDGTAKELVQFEGHFEQRGKLHPYYKPGYHKKDVDLDAELIEGLASDLTNVKKSRDGINPQLFPLTGEKQAKYRFLLEGTEVYKGRRAHRVTFQPKEPGDFGWAGEVLVDADEYQPIRVTTRLNKRLPRVVTIGLGTNLKQAGFTLAYHRVAQDVWFPASYGTEFRLDVLRFYKRVITMSLTAEDFRRADVDSTVDFDLQAAP